VARKSKSDALRDRVVLLCHWRIWGAFPVAMRAFYVAQRGRCPYCPALLNPTDLPHSKAPLRATWDHVFPKSRFRYRVRNKVLAHSRCNTQKGGRPPTACESLFLEITNAIVDDLRKAI
jgi:hypothetical protein